jgi:hypothetical protein
MLVGHLAVGMLAKRIEPRISLGTLTLAALTPDVLWGVFMMVGIEHVRTEPGSGQAIAIDASYSHSLLMGVVWGALLAAAYFWRRHYPRGAWVLFAAVMSHWLLDFISHSPDMTIAPGLPQRFGLGLWSSVPATLVVEGGLWIAALIVYVRATGASKRMGVYAFWPVVVFLTAAWINNFAGPPPPDVSAMGVSSLIFFSLTIAWAYWMNRLRPMASPQQ